MANNKYIIPSVGTATLFSSATGAQIVNGNTLTDSTIDWTVTEKEIRGGFLGGLLGKIFTSPQLNVTITDALFELEYLALTCGGSIIEGGDALTVTSVKTTVANQISVAPAIPVEFLGKAGYGEYTITGESNWKPLTFNGSTATVVDLPKGTQVCVRYVVQNDAMRSFTVSSSFIPSELYLVLTLPLFKANQSQVYTDSAKVGEIQVHIPRFQLNGTQSLSLTMDGASTTSLSGSALADLTNVTCNNTSGIYAEFKEIVYGKDEFADVQGLAIEGNDIDLSVGEKSTLNVYAFYGGMTLPKLLDNSTLTFTSLGTSVATVGANTGEITGVADGTTNVEVFVTGKPALKAVASVTVA